MNLLEELNQKIEQLEQSVNTLRLNLTKETSIKSIYLNNSFKARLYSLKLYFT